MKTNTLLQYPLLILLITSTTFISCSEEEDGGPLNNSDVSAQVEEYPRNGDFVATAASSLSGELTFALTTVSINDAFLLDEQSGVLTVANPFAFDYETNTEITGQITVSNGTETEVLSVFVEVIDIDDIEYILTDSKSAYQAASAGDWVPITSNEYLSLFVQISETSKSGTTDELFEAGVSVGVFTAYYDFTIANDAAPIPDDSYVFAFKYWSDESEAQGNKVKVSSTSLTEGYSDLGGILPSGGRGEHNFVLKGGDSPTTGSGYLGMYSQAGLAYDVRGNAPGNHYFVEGDQATIGANFNVVQTICLYQGLSTPIKQWD